MNVTRWKIGAVLLFLSTLLTSYASNAATTTAASKSPSPVKRTTVQSQKSARTPASRHAVSAKPKPKPTPKPKPRSRVAPADEYFGRQKMSILGVRNKVKDFGVRVDIHPAEGPSVLGAALDVEDAMRDWARKYPYDYWLPRYAYALENVYEIIPGAAAHERAIRQLNYIIAYFPASPYAKIGRFKEIQGIPTPDPSATPAPDDALRRLAILDGKVKPTLPPAFAPPSASPTPLAMPSAEASPMPSESPNASQEAAPQSPAPAASSPQPSPSPSPSASPSPEPSSLPSLPAPAAVGSPRPEPTSSLRS